jgi:hypothetical protein
MIKQMSRGMNLSPHDAISCLIDILAKERNLHIQLEAPSNVSEEDRSAMFLLALVSSGIAKEMPSA